MFILRVFSKRRIDQYDEYRGSREEMESKIEIANSFNRHYILLDQDQNKVKSSYC